MTDLDRLAKKIAKAALKRDVSLGDMLDAFKALSAYDVASRKVAAKEPPLEDDESPSLDAIRKRINAAEIDGGVVQ